ncbi:MAG: hypothetical protein CMF23_07935 [Ignavibacteriae bacterium]|nr:hypothetical protein [Ignavibacteriota bacterium]
MKIRTFKKYTKKFKDRVLSELESGELNSYAEARRKYNIRGKMTIKKWIINSKKYHLLHNFKVIDV